MDPAAILIAPVGVSGPLRGLMDRLSSVGVLVTIVEDLQTATELSGNHEAPPAILVDLRDVAAGEVEDVRRAVLTVKRTISGIPHCLPVVVTTDATSPLVVACMRAGAGDVIDLQLEGTATARAVVQRICQKQAEEAQLRGALASQRAMVEDLLRDLIRTERRTIDAEEALAARMTGTTSIAESRAPAILVVEHERVVANKLVDLLEEAGVTTYAYVTGEEAVRDGAHLAESTGLDLALIAAQLPGLDGLETVRQLRERVAGLPAFLMTSVHDADLAAHAADLGVVGFVHKPLADVTDLVARLAQLAEEALTRTREALYLQRIKERHEHVLARYRSLPRAL